ncbi:ATP-binding cassette domain-containing protein [Kibdelosporangium aridum]|uniref:ABC-2 type transport system ATP-binding protein n=1 Tax=Kibdelosporangium aridum TaxID=2030 RepID=A0A1W2CIX2_KIBAR|nr:ATP-binding cassette domain-containing protein [Kibdelosporangium aridum]SMC85140.1 ABC-2 type transport system ATP-binding protein [Kibdelosporangium aridum]
MIVEVEGLKKAYGDNVVLAGIDLHVPEGSVYALLGPNGAGKTTTVRILTTLTRPDAGKVLVAGHDVVREPAKVRAEISLTGQHAAVDNEQTGRENLVMTGQLMHLGRSAARRRADQLLERFDLLDAMHRRVKTYSGGMRRRLDLAMSLVAEPKLIFLDEPTTGLDPASRTTMWDAIKELVRAGTTVVLTTQYLEEADRLADWIVLINKGAVAMSGTADSLKAQVGGERMELTFDDETSVLRAAELLGGQVNRERRVLDLPSDGTAAHVHSVLNHLEAFRVSVARVSSHRPTLDDVFMAVTADRPREGANA